eukprot:4897793-Alexandrium_andersonii.AAC.1
MRCTVTAARSAASLPALHVNPWKGARGTDRRPSSSDGRMGGVRACPQIRQVRGEAALFSRKSSRD